LAKDRQPPGETVIESRVAYEGRLVRVREDRVRLSGGREAGREVVEHDEVSAIVPVDADGNVLLVRQYRLPAEQALLEVPAGGLDEGETPEAAAQRELQEETGYRAGTLERLGGFYVSPGYCTEFIHVFLARGLSESAAAADADEDIRLQRVPLDRALEMARSGEIRDGKSIIGLLLAEERLGR
jgi:ADP-ribose pyrophosphatase